MAAPSSAGSRELKDSSGASSSFSAILVFVLNLNVRPNSAGWVISFIIVTYRGGKIINRIT
jgi:hypothetical protein